jgi:hypothetical protein
MALNPNIPLSVQGLDAAGAIGRGFQLGQNIRQAPLRNQLLQQSVTAGQQQQDIRRQQLQQDKLKRQLFGAQKAVASFGKGNFAGVIDSIRESFPGDEERQDAEIKEFQDNPELYISQAQDDISAFQSQFAGQRSASASASAPKTIRKQVGEDANGEPVFGLFESQVVFDPSTNQSTINEIPLGGDLVTATGETITAKRAAEVKFSGEKAEAVAGGKATGESKKAPLIAKAKASIETAVKLATAEATARGETLTEVSRAKASLPGLRDVVGELKELASIATSTIGGRLFNTASKELGFGSTKGGNARAKFVAVVNNQVLPLLKPTFGAAFTFQEGEALKATMGDPDTSPAEKMVQLESFIEGKAREIQAKERELGQAVTPTQELTTGQPAPQATRRRRFNPQTGRLE